MHNPDNTKMILSEIQKVSDALSGRISELQQVVNIYNFTLNALMNAIRDHDSDFRDIYLEKITGLSEGRKFSEQEKVILENYLKVLRHGEPPELNVVE